MTAEQWAAHFRLTSSLPRKSVSWRPRNGKEERPIIVNGERFSSVAEAMADLALKPQNVAVMLRTGQARYAE